MATQEVKLVQLGLTLEDVHIAPHLDEGMETPARPPACAQ
jgi:hypothetical protein